MAVSLPSKLQCNLERGFAPGGLTVSPLCGASQIAPGAVFILVMIFRPRGIMGDFELSFATLNGFIHRNGKGTGQ